MCMYVNTTHTLIGAYQISYELILFLKHKCIYVTFPSSQQSLQHSETTMSTQIVSHTYRPVQLAHKHSYIARSTYQNNILIILATNRTRHTYRENPSAFFELQIVLYWGRYGNIPPNTMKNCTIHSIT